MESYLVRQLSSVPCSAGCAGAAFRLMRAAGVVPTAGLLDLLGLGLGRRPHLLKVIERSHTRGPLVLLDRMLGVGLRSCVSLSATVSAV